METKLVEVVKNHEREIKQVLNDYIDIKKQKPKHVFVTQCLCGHLNIRFDENDIPVFNQRD